MSDQSPEIQYSEQDLADLAQLGVHSEADAAVHHLFPNDEVPSFHPVLHVWKAVLEPAAKEAEARISPAWANRICSSYRELNYSDMPDYQARYFGLLMDLAGCLDDEIATDPDCLTYTTPQEDAEKNSRHYKNLLISWQKEVLARELEWDCSASWAAVEIAAISEVHKMFFGQTGLTAFLDNIKFEYTDEDRDELAEQLQVLRDHVEEGR